MASYPILHNKRYPKIVVESDVIYTDESIISKFSYDSVIVDLQPSSGEDQTYLVKKKTTNYVIKTDKKIPKLGVLVVGLGGNNGSTLLGGIIANKYNVSYETKDQIIKPNFYGSLIMSSTIKLGTKTDSSDVGKPIFVPMFSFLPFVNPEDILIGGWDISDMNLGDSMRRARVFDLNLQEKLYPYMENIKPMKGVFFENFVASNQKSRANNVHDLDSHKNLLEKLRNQIRDFKSMNNLDKVIVIWSANTERCAEIIEGINDTSSNLLKTINDQNHPEISPSVLYAVASILEGCSFINGSPQNTLCDAIVEMAVQHNVFIGGSDFKSGQTKMKTVIVDFLISAGIKPRSIVSYNHLGNNDGYNLSNPKQFRSKELSKSNVIDDMIDSNPILYPPNTPSERPDHVVVIKYVPYVGDSKKAMDEYNSEIFMGGKNSIVIHNKCEDSLLCAPLMIDLILLTEMCERIHIKKINDKCDLKDEMFDGYSHLHPALSILGYMLKSPITTQNTPVINALFKQRECIANFLRLTIGIPPENHLPMEYMYSC